MMRLTKSALATALGTAALFANSPATAQPADIDPQMVSAAARYALPVAFDGFVERCSARLDPAGYALTNRNAIRAKFADGVDEAWPEARQVLMQFGAEEAGDMGAVFEMLDDAELRPFVDGLIEGLVAQEIKPDDCGMIERGLEIVDPLPADNVAEMVGFLFEIGVAEDAQDADGMPVQ